MKPLLRTGALLVVSTGLLGTALGAGGSAVPDSLRACARKQDVLQRLSCYDSEMAKLDSAPAAAPAAVIAAPPAAPVAAAPPAVKPPPSPPSLGSEQLRNRPAASLGEEQVHKSSPLKFWGAKDKEPDTGMTARIQELRKSPYGLAILTLDNGQVWRQLEAEDNFPLAAGDTIRIDRGALGSYKLMPVREGWKRFIRVTRSQ